MINKNEYIFLMNEYVKEIKWYNLAYKDYVIKDKKYTKVDLFNTNQNELYQGIMNYV